MKSAGKLVPDVKKDVRVSMPAQAPAAPVVAPVPRGETLRGPLAGFNPVRSVSGMFPGRMEEIPINERITDMIDYEIDRILNGVLLK